MSGIQLRQSANGPLLKGNTGDVPIYSAEDELWFAGAAPGVDLPDGTAVDQVLTWNPNAQPEPRYEPKGRIATYVFATLAAFQAAFPPVDGVHSITEGLVEFQAGTFDLGENRIQLDGRAKIVGWGQGETTITSTSPDGTVIVLVGGCEFADIHIRNVGNGGLTSALLLNAPVVAGNQQECVLTNCALGTLIQDDPWSNPAAVLDGSLKLIDCTIGDGGIAIPENASGSTVVMQGGRFIVNSIGTFGVSCGGVASAIALHDVYFEGARAGMVEFGETAGFGRLEIVNCVEGYTGSQSDYAVASAVDWDFAAEVHIYGNTFAGGIGGVPSNSCAVQCWGNTFGAHLNNRTPFSFDETSPGVCLRNNYDSDIIGYLKETPTMNASFAFTSLADLEAAFPETGGVHTLDQNAIYTILGSGFDLSGERIVLQLGVLRGQFRTTTLSSNVADSVVQVDNDPNNRVENLTIHNTGAGGDLTRTALELTVDATAVDCTLRGNDVGSAVLMNRGTLRDCIIRGSTVAGVYRPVAAAGRATLINPTWQDGSGDMIRVLGSGTVNCSGARVTQGTYTNWVNFVGASSANTELYAVNNDVGDRDIVVAAGQQPQIINLHANALGNINCATADVPAGGLIAVGNHMTIGAYTGFSATDPRVMVRGNFVGTSALSETPITP